MATSRSRIGSGEPIDALLGARDRRYFGNGFRQGVVRLRRAGRSFGVGGDSRFVGLGTVGYSAPWSVKASGPQNPHVSTIDAYLLAISAASSLLGPRGTGADQPLGAAWVRRCAIKAGGAPIEDGLDRIPVSATWAHASTDPAARVLQVSVTVGSMLVTVDVDPGGGVRAPSAVDRPRTYRTTVSDLVDVEVAPGSAEVSATVHYSTGQGEEDLFQEIESRYPESLTFAEAFADMLQLGQVGLYAMDGLARADSDTLWMRNTLFEATSPFRPRVQGDRVTAEIRSPRVVTMRGRRWRIATLRSRRASMALSCSVAHALPELRRDR
ncbi:AvrD family protein [Saccharothrix texasensis]|uniref:Avirulence D protein (AvrD) n=1 Tax=Saccharothrix texasensis TaxID=103734 RepID=A0A3N1HH68_9PSEU|nr:AvrD family protein [Saccharothrix texasensis]ROP41814.1 avirulence D protein (AvrD) [Saccharothrix texasensis]